MSKGELEETGNFRIELPKKLWQIIKAVAPLVGMRSSDVVEKILQEWVDEHVMVTINDKEITIEEVRTK